MKTATHFKRFGTEPKTMATGSFYENGAYIPCGYVKIEEIDFRYVSKHGLVEL